MLKALSPINGSDKNFDFFFLVGGGDAGIDMP